MALFYPRAGCELTVVFDGRGAPNKTFTIDHVRPRSCKVSRNGYHEADTFHLVFDARVLPLDPEAIASIGVKIYMWNSGGDENKEWQLEQNEMIRGLVDEDTIEISKDQELTCSGRDYTAVLDAEWDTKVSVPSGVPLDEAVQFCADKAAPPGNPNRFVVSWDASTDPVTSAGAARSTKKKGMWIKPGKTTWDVIYDLCIQHGFIVFIRKSTIHISDPRTQTQQSLALAPKLTHGRDLMELKVHRKLARERVPQIKLVYWDAKQKQRFDVLYPTQGQKITTGIGTKKNEIETLPAPVYCHDRESAERFAKMRWELLARGETSYTFKTRHMTVPTPTKINTIPETGEDFVSDDQEFNLLTLEAGDAIGVRFDPFNGEQMRALDFARRVAFLEALGYKRSLAAFVATNYERLNQFRQSYYVHRADFDWDNSSGLEIEVEAVNFAYERREIAYADSFVPADAISGAG